MTMAELATRPDPAAAVFDLEKYCRQAGRQVTLTEALADYRSHGEAAGALPHPLFQPSHVAPQIARLTVRAQAASLLDSYLELAAGGAAIDPHPLFDAAHYTSLAGPFGPGETPLGHYVAALASREVPPSPTLLFDRTHYGRIDNFPCGLLHYLALGGRERRSPHPLFMPHHFLHGCLKAGIKVTKETDPLLLYLDDRRTWAVQTHTLFDPADYAASLSRLGLPPWENEPPLLHFLRRAPMASTHIAFDPDFYRRHAAALGIKLAEAPILHHLRTGGRSGIAPHPLFSPAYYLAASGDVQASRLDPLQHFLRHGLQELRSFHPLMALRYPGLDAADRAHPKTDRFRWYLHAGAKTLAGTSKLFDAALYAAGHPACLAPGETPLAHFVRSWSEAGVFCPPWGTALFERRPDFAPPEPADLIVVAHELTRTGAPLILLALLREFVGRHGLRVLVIAQRGGALLEAFREWAPVIDMDIVRAAGIAPAAFIQSCVKAFEGPAKPMAALVNTACADAAGQAIAEAGLPVITLVHELAAGFDRTTFEAIYESSAAVIYPAAYVMREAHTRFSLPVEKSAILPQGLLDPGFGSGDRTAARRRILPMLEAPANAFLVLGCGTVDLRKGVDLFAAAAAASIAAQDADADGAQRAGRPLYFIWLGGGPEERHSLGWYLREDIARGVLAGRFLFAGAQAAPEAFFLASDAFLLTSRLDPFPCVVHEAMACGLPVIAFENAGGAPEALASDAGLVVPYGNVAAMAAHLVRLANDPHAATAIGARARARVRAQYDFAAYAESLIDAFAQRAGVNLLPANPAPPRAQPKRGRVIFAVPEANATAEGRLFATLVSGLRQKDFDAELILTAPRPNAATMAGFGKQPRRVLATTLTHRPAPEPAPEIDTAALLTLLAASAPAILVYGADAVAAAVTPHLPARVGVLGLPPLESHTLLEQAARAGGAWQGCAVPFEAARQQLLMRVPSLAGKCEVIPPPARISPAPQPGAAGAKLRLLCLLPGTPTDGSIKPVAALIDALSDVDCRLTVIGPDEDVSALAALFAGKLAHGRLDLLEAANVDIVMQALASAEILVAFDDLSQAPAGIGDILGAGLAVIDAAGGAWASALEHRESVGPVVPRGNTLAVAREVQALATERARLQGYRARAHALALTHFVSLDDHLDRFASLLDRMLTDLRHAR